MKKISLIISLLTVSFASSWSQGIKPPPEGKAVVYFVRVSKLGMIIDFTYFDSAKVIGQFNSQNYIRYECEPGKHLFWAHSENQDFITADLEAGKIYFVEAVPSLGMLYAQVFLHPIDPSDSKRMEKLEAIGDSFQGVVKAYAIQAGRELRIMVEPTEINDNEAALLAREITKKIEQELEYPGQIKVTVCRETRAVEYAK